MNFQRLISLTKGYFSRKKLQALLADLVSKYKDLLEKYNRVVKEKEALEEEVKRLKSLQVADRIKSVNQQANKPSSKQAEWEIKGVGNDGQGKKKRRGKKGRKGAGNKPKNKEVTRKELVVVEKCANCGKDLRDKPSLESENRRIIEDIPDLPMALEVIQVIQEKKYCNDCQQVTTGRSILALPNADIGLNTTVLAAFLWISMCLPFTRISSLLKHLYGQKLSTAGLSAHLIRVSKILEVVYEEILEELRLAVKIHADETGWRVNGKKWWLWVIGNEQGAYYIIDKSRGKDVVHRMLGEIFLGVLIVDGWKAYLSVMCEQQSCMAHLLRKIRKIFAAFPKLRSVYKFYIKFRKILRDGQRLQKQRDSLEDHVFKRRLKRLHDRLDELLKWRNPNDILKDIIKKVKKSKTSDINFYRTC